MTQESIIRYIADNFTGVDILRPGPGSEPAIAIGDTFFSYDPDGILPPEKKFPFATIVTKDYGEFDNLSNLDRPEVFRLNIGVSRKTYERLFGMPPGPVAADAYEYAAFDRLFRHPVYSQQAWVCALNPSDRIFKEIEPLLDEAYDRAVKRLNRPEG